MNSSSVVEPALQFLPPNLTPEQRKEIRKCWDIIFGYIPEYFGSSLGLSLNDQKLVTVQKRKSAPLIKTRGFAEKSWMSYTHLRQHGKQILSPEPWPPANFLMESINHRLYGSGQIVDSWFTNITMYSRTAILSRGLHLKKLDDAATTTGRTKRKDSNTMNISAHFLKRGNSCWHVKRL
jgi:hypothetical protein